MAKRPAPEVYRDLRAAAESGWDFSSRWLTDDKDLATIRTTALIPVDLNSLMAHLEETLAKAYRGSGDRVRAREFEGRASKRQAAIRRLLWDDGKGAFTDYVWALHKLTGKVTAATLYPLFFEIATPTQARTVARTARGKLLMPGGIATTLVNSGQQWDQPNGWAPLQWIAVAGLDKYGEKDLARTIAGRWIGANLRGFRKTRTFVEKYNVVSPSGSSGGGEYATQVGFGWTNGVLLQLLALYPELAPGDAASQQ